MNQLTLILFVLGILIGLIILTGFAQRRILARLRESQNVYESKLTALQQQLSETEASVVNAVSLASLGFKYPVNLGGPSIDPFHARHLLFILQLIKPKKILELGSGSSTVLIATVLEKLGCQVERHIAVDHESQFLEMTREVACLNNVESAITFEHCPLLPCDGFTLDWYSRISDIKNSGPFDLIVVDGPPAYAPGTELARLPALMVLEDALSDQGVLVLDDCNRPGERSVIAQWKEAFPKLHFSIYAEGKGVCIVSKRSQLW